MNQPFMTWAEWCRLAHERPLPREVLDDIALLEQAGFPDENEAAEKVLPCPEILSTSPLTSPGVP
jgi:hypothetical protein